MLGYERVEKAVEFSCPDRIPLDCSDRCSKLFGWRNCVRVTCLRYAPTAGKDDWGCVWEKPPKDSGIVNEGVVKEHPLANASLEERSLIKRRFC